MSVVFTGAYETSLGGFPTIRGFASLRDIVDCSFADEAYQRDPDPGHVNELMEFFRGGEYLFFPELVLSAHLEVDYNADDKPDDDPVALIRARKAFKSNKTGIEVKPRGSRSGDNKFDVVVPNKLRLFKRIDGNHRLKAYEELQDPRFDRYMAPFCLVLFGFERDARRNEKALFHNINSKAKALTSEELYKGIVDAKEDFSDSDLRDRFGPEYLQCRQLKDRLKFDYLTNLRGVFGQNEDQKACVRSVIIRSLQDLAVQVGVDNVPGTDDVLKAIKAVDQTYADGRLQTSVAPGLFSAFLFFQLNRDRALGTYEQFRNWVLQTHQYELQSINAADLIKIFGKIAQSRKRQVFVSMQFSAETKPNYDAIKSAVDDLNKEHNLDIAIRPIRIDQFDTGFSYVINDEILRLIEDSGYLIADLTCGNKNVYHEIGYLMGLNRAKGLKDENFLLIHNGKIGDSEKDIGFNIKNIKQERKDDTNSLREAVKRQMAVYFKLTEKVES
ncbi:hypothetical protein DXM29_23615 [Agrobacterium tumefaciens]|uniref:hypothetical protein n=1 Tax=Agrobacterium tumefaciens TaxID=358 RepID=UPI0012301552|nr:hypothetical protein DXM29_23615 [Agrobacterium tumefaciens]